MAREESDTQLYYLDEHASDSEDSNCQSNFEIVASKKAIGKPSSSSIKKTVQASKWNEEHVIALLKAVIQFQREKGSPENDKVAYYQFIKSKIWEGATRKQIYEKLRTLKRNFEKTKARLQQHGGVINASPHDINVFELSKKMWDCVDTQFNDQSVLVPNGKGEEERDNHTVISDDTFVVPKGNGEGEKGPKGNREGERGDRIASVTVVPKGKGKEEINNHTTTNSDIVVVPKGKGEEERGDGIASVTVVPKEKGKEEMNNHTTTNDDTVVVPKGKGKGEGNNHTTTSDDTVVVPEAKGKGEKDNNNNGTTTDDTVVVPKRKREEGDIELYNLSGSELRRMDERFRRQYRHLYGSVDVSKVVVLHHLFMIGDEKANELNGIMFQLNIKEEKLRRKMRKLETWQADLIQDTLESSTKV